MAFGHTHRREVHEILAAEETLWKLCWRGCPVEMPLAYYTIYRRSGPQFSRERRSGDVRR
jgi:hypothetical protein